MCKVHKANVIVADISRLEEMEEKERLLKESAVKAEYNEKGQILLFLYLSKSVLLHDILD